MKIRCFASTPRRPANESRGAARRGGARLCVEFIFFRRQFLVIIFCALLAVTDGLIRSSTAVILDARRGQFFQQQSIPGDASADMAWVESQVEILKSENIANSVIKAEICRQQRQSVGSGTGFVGAGTPSPKSEWCGSTFEATL